MQPVATVVGGLAAVNTDPGLELVVTSAAFAWLPLLAGLYTVCAVHYYRDRQSGLLPVKVRQSGGRGAGGGGAVVAWDCAPGWICCSLFCVQRPRFLFPFCEQ